MYVYAVVITSSPSPTPSTRRINSAAAVAEFRQATLLVPMYSANSFSNRFVFGPVVIQPLFSASTTSAISSSVISGGENAICLFSIVLILHYRFFMTDFSKFTQFLIHFFISFQVFLSDMISWNDFRYDLLYTQTFIHCCLFQFS